MKQVTETFFFFEKGDRVLTPEGSGVISKDEKIDGNFIRLGVRTVFVTIDEGAGQLGGETIEIDGWLPLSLVEDDDYKVVSR